jgi:hypothetical protein
MLGSSSVVLRGLDMAILRGGECWEEGRKVSLPPVCALSAWLVQDGFETFLPDGFSGAGIIDVDVWFQLEKGDFGCHDEGCFELEDVSD